MSTAALEALLREQLESDCQDEEALRALGQAEAAKRDEAQKTLSRQLLVKISTRNNTEEHADDYKPQDDDGIQGDEPQDDDGIQEMMKRKKTNCKKMKMGVIQCFKMRMTVTWMTTVG
jgi:hypothetical protein